MFLPSISPNHLTPYWYHVLLEPQWLRTNYTRTPFTELPLWFF